MTDKEKIREKIEELFKHVKDSNFESDSGAFYYFKDLLEYIDSLQEEPVSIWHDSSEEPDDKSSCLIHYIVGGEVSYRDIFPVLYNEKVKEFVSEPYPHPTGYKVEQKSLEGGCVAEVYKNMRDRFPLSDIYKWAYINDILNLSNIERTVKIWKDAQGDDLPEIDREVVALLDNGKVVFAHRPPEYWDGKNIITGKVTRNYVERYDKGLWNIPNVKYWLDVELPK